MAAIRLVLLLTVFACGPLLSGCDSSGSPKAEPAAQTPASAETVEKSEEPAASATDEEYIQAAHRLTGHFARGDYEALLAMFDETMKAAGGGRNDLWEQSWNKVKEYGGDFEKIGVSVAGREKDGDREYAVVKHDLIFSRARFIQRTAFSLDGKVAGLFFLPGQITVDADGAAKYQPSKKSQPEGLVETEVTIESQPGLPLKGTLTRPDGPVKAVLLLIPGSGPMDRDEKMHLNHPFRDLAHGLAQKGLASLRFDKITHAYAGKIASSPNAERFTLDEEIVIDAVNAFKWLQAREDFKGQDIFLLGHSQGGSIAAYINSKGADAAGYVVLGAISGPVWEVQYQQTIRYLDGLKASGELEESKYDHKWAEAELAKAKRLEDMTDEEVLKETIFNAPAWYIRHEAGMRPTDRHLADRKPVLVLHGARDRQVFAEHHQVWREKLKDHPAAAFRLYERLNHLFGEYRGDPVPYNDLVKVEYAQRTPIPQYVIDDISNWINKNLASKKAAKQDPN